MILPRDRKIAHWMVKRRLWRIKRQELFGTPTLVACWGTHWLLERMRKRQVRDGLHHAPMCPGNEWAGANLVFMACNCGAARMARKAASKPEGLRP